jgi:DNA-binding NtrC family response regulator
MSVWTTVRTWFFENAWPVIQTLLEAVVERAMAWLAGRVAGILDESAAGLSQKAIDNANAELEKAEKSVSESETQQHQAVATVWRQVAEDILKENDRIKRSLADILAEERSVVTSRITTIQPDDLFEDLSSEQVRLKLNGIDLFIPATVMSKPTDESKA